MTSNGRLHAAIAVAVLAAPLIVGSALAAWALSQSPLHSSAPEEPLLGTVEASQRRDLQPTSATLIPAETYPVVSQSAGTITGLSLVPGKEIKTGKTALEVDGRPVVAYVSGSPLYRDITEGLSGEDVRTAGELLVELGYLTSAGSHADHAMSSAIRTFNASHGQGKANQTLSVGSLLWVPKGSAAPKSVTARVGRTVSPQTELYTTTSGQDRIVISTASAATDRRLSVGSSTAILRAGQTTISDPTEVAAIVEALGENKSASATLEPVSSRTVGSVPASAVVVAVNGSACFFASVTGPGVRIQAETGTFGMVDVAADLIGSPVLINPRSSRTDLTCS